VAGDVPEVKEIEELLSLVLFQWNREGLLDDVGSSLVSFEEREILPPEQARRLLDLHKILSLTFDEREKDDSTRLKRITERFSKRYPNDPWDAVARASQHYEEGNYSKAATILLEVPTYDSPPASATDFFRALCLLQANRTSRDGDSDGSEREALDLLRDVAQRLREEAQGGSSFAAVAYPSTLIYEGIVHFYGARWTQAISAFEGATHSADANLRARALNGLGFVHFITGDLYKAELHLTRALEVDRAFVTARLNLGYVELAKGQHFLARKIFRGVQEDWKGDRSHRYFVLGQLGRAHSEQTIYETSERALDEQLVELYADALRFWRLDDYEHISPLHLRLAHIQEAVALKIYRDPQLYGLDIMSLVMLVRAQRLVKHATGTSLASELRGRIDAAIQEVIPKVNEEWIEKRPRAAFFLPLGDLGDGVLDQRRET
jgi:tetratricopeptide (TPR) repeat protein